MANSVVDGAREPLPAGFYDLAVVLPVNLEPEQLQRPQVQTDFVQVGLPSEQFVSQWVIPIIYPIVPDPFIDEPRWVAVDHGFEHGNQALVNLCRQDVANKPLKRGVDLFDEGLFVDRRLILRVELALECVGARPAPNGLSWESRPCGWISTTTTR